MGSLLQEHRCILHAGIMERIEALYAWERLAEQIERSCLPCVPGRDGRRPWPTASKRGRRPWRDRPTTRPWGPRAGTRCPAASAGAARHAREQAIDLQLTLVRRSARSATLGGSWRLPCEVESLAEGLDDLG